MSHKLDLLLLSSLQFAIAKKRMKIKDSVFEFNEFKLRLKSQPVSIDRRLKSWKINTNLSGTNKIWAAA